MPDYDVAVVGASIAGSAVATLLGHQGYRVWLADRAHFPRPKICGEGLMPEGVLLLHRLGVSLPAEGKGIFPFRGLRLEIGGRASLELLFSELSRSVQGLVTDRAAFDRLLVDHARTVSNVDVCERAEVESTLFQPDLVTLSTRSGARVTSRLLIGANGIRSNLHQQVGIARYVKSRERMALRSYFPRVANLKGLVEVFATTGAEAYLAPMGQGARVTVLFQKDHETRAQRNGGSIQKWYAELLNRFSGLTERLPQSIPYPVEATAPVTLQLPVCHAHRLVLIGDAAGTSDPIAGQGMSQALKDAFLAGQLLTPLLKEDRLGCADLAEYTRLRQTTFARSIQIADTLLFLARHPRIARRAVATLSRKDALRWKILNAVAGNGDGTLSRRDRLRLITGI